MNNFFMVMLKFFLFIISLFIMFLANLISKKTFLDREKNSAVEFGFDPKCYARMPFSLQFFLIAVIFLIFDVEITLLIPFIYIMKISFFKIYLLSLMFFLLILLLGLYHEWNQGTLNWYL